MKETTSLEISIATQGKLHNIQHQIEQVLRRKVSLDQTINIILIIKSIDQQLADIIAEVEPKEWRKPTKKDLNAEDVV
jgi:hypothetical protein